MAQSTYVIRLIGHNFRRLTFSSVKIFVGYNFCSKFYKILSIVTDEKFLTDN